MKSTRQIIVLHGRTKDINFVLKQLQFKGITQLRNSELFESNILEVFKNNKSVLCYGNRLPKRFKEIAKSIPVVNWEDKNWRADVMQCINISSGDVVKQFQEIAEVLEWDIGDHKSNDSGINGAPSISDCAYCKYLNGLDENKNRKAIYSSKYFFVIPTLGEFANGYLLIIPYRHVTSFAELNAKERQEFPSVLSDVKSILELTYGKSDFLVWENGTGNGGKGKSKNSIVHAHMHIAIARGVNADYIEDMLGTKLRTIKYADLPAFKKHSYLLVQTGENEWKINDNPNLYIPRQYVRQLLAQKYGFMDDVNWNWRKAPFYEKMEETEKDIYSAIYNSEKYISERIRVCIKEFMENMTGIVI